MTETTNQEEAQLVVKLPKVLREAFVEACQRNDTTASREVRAFIREYLRKHGQANLDL